MKKIRNRTLNLNFDLYSGRNEIITMKLAALVLSNDALFVLVLRQLSNRDLNIACQNHFGAS